MLLLLLLLLLHAIVVVVVVMTCCGKCSRGESELLLLVDVVAVVVVVMLLLLFLCSVEMADLLDTLTCVGCGPLLAREQLWLLVLQPLLLLELELLLWLLLLMLARLDVVLRQSPLRWMVGSAFVVAVAVEVVQWDDNDGRATVTVGDLGGGGAVVGGATTTAGGVVVTAAATIVRVWGDVAVAAAFGFVGAVVREAVVVTVLEAAGLLLFF